MSSERSVELSLLLKPSPNPATATMPKPAQKKDLDRDHDDLKSMVDGIMKTMSSFKEDLEKAKKEDTPKKQASLTTLEERFLSFKTAVENDLRRVTAKLRGIGEEV